MKHGTTSKLKFKKLRRALGDPPLYQVVGLLEALWQLTAADAPLGDIGKFSNEDIAIAVEWQAKPDELIEALVATEWLDESDKFRLVIHHWDQHVPDYLRKRVQRRGESFVTGQNGELELANPSTADIGGQRPPLADSGSLPSQAEPNPTESEPSPTQPNPTEPDGAHRSVVPDRAVPAEPATTGSSSSDSEQRTHSGSGSAETENPQDIAMRIAQTLRVVPEGAVRAGSAAQKQAKADAVTIAKVVHRCRGDPGALREIERLASEVAKGDTIRNARAAWVKRVKDARLFYETTNQ